ncbi:MAG: hypothetical protein E2O52_10405 [Gammaproteobacteria bacterium]|nr:MAG: hypothetical protein E2O52_10405 [Gammaproteobacteria bacterium]
MAVTSTRSFGTSMTLPVHVGWGSRSGTDAWPEPRSPVCGTQDPALAPPGSTVSAASTATASQPIGAVTVAVAGTGEEWEEF